MKWNQLRYKKPAFCKRVIVKRGFAAYLRPNKGILGVCWKLVLGKETYTVGAESADEWVYYDDLLTKGDGKNDRTGSVRAGKQTLENQGDTSSNSENA